MAEHASRWRTPQGQPKSDATRRAITNPDSPAMANGDRVRWQDKAGLFRRDLGNGDVEVTIANRAYRVRIADLRPGGSRHQPVSGCSSIVIAAGSRAKIATCSSNSSAQMRSCSLTTLVRAVLINSRQRCAKSRSDAGFIRHPHALARRRRCYAKLRRSPVPTGELGASKFLFGLHSVVYRLLDHISIKLVHYNPG